MRYAVDTHTHTTQAHMGARPLSPIFRRIQMVFRMKVEEERHCHLNTMHKIVATISQWKWWRSVFSTIDEFQPSIIWHCHCHCPPAHGATVRPTQVHADNSTTCQWQTSVCLMGHEISLNENMIKRGLKRRNTKRFFFFLFASVSLRSTPNFVIPNIIAAC